MIELELVRVGSSPRGTFGALRHDSIPFVLTLERPWRNNESNISCIPAGRYLCKRVRSPRFGDTFEITLVPGRTHVLFHKGNYVEDTEGCILVGEEFSGTFDRPMLVSSERGFGELMLLLKGQNEFWLTVVDAPPSVPHPVEV